MHFIALNRHCEERSDEAIHLSGMPRDGLLREACHRARIRATRWLAMTALSHPRKTKCPEASPGMMSSLCRVLKNAYAWLSIFLPSAACAAARRAIGTRYGEHET